jgi:hypothetical protein
MNLTNVESAVLRALLRLSPGDLPYWGRFDGRNRKDSLRESVPGLYYSAMDITKETQRLSGAVTLLVVEDALEGLARGGFAERLEYEVGERTLTRYRISAAGVAQVQGLTAAGVSP